MWDKIKKAINSNLSKPLDTFMTEQFNSWATQRGRLDAAISTRATNNGVWLEPSKTLSLVVASDTTQLSFATEKTISISGTSIFKFLNNYKGTAKITFDYLLTSASSTYALEISTIVDGIKTTMITLNQTSPGSSTSYRTASFELPLHQGVTEISGLMIGTGTAFKVKNFKVQYTPYSCSALVLM